LLELLDPALEVRAAVDSHVVFPDPAVTRRQDGLQDLEEEAQAVPRHAASGKDQPLEALALEESVDTFRLQSSKVPELPEDVPVLLLGLPEVGKGEVDVDRLVVMPLLRSDRLPLPVRVQDARVTEGQRRADEQEQTVKEAVSAENSSKSELGGSVTRGPLSVKASRGASEAYRTEIERQYKLLDNKIKELDTWLPKLKAQIREFFTLSKTVKSVYIQLDDFYHLTRVDQPMVMDYIHRLCKDVPIYFKVARSAS
jgi:hypothetical protein